MVAGQVGFAVEVGVVGQLLRHILHLVDGDRHPGGGRLLRVLLPSLIVVPAVGQLAVWSTDVRHISLPEKNWGGSSWLEKW